MAEVVNTTSQDNWSEDYEYEDEEPNYAELRIVAAPKPPPHPKLTRAMYKLRMMLHLKKALESSGPSKKK